MIKDFFRKMRLDSFIALRSVKFSSNYLQSLYKIYLNHTKVIHWRKGYPVYTMLSPALYSKPMTNFMARQFYKSVNGKNIPNFMSFAINDKCDANCKHCSFFNGVDDSERTVLSTEDAKAVIRGGQDIGVSVISLVGGEPLLREDLNEIIESVDKDLSTVVVFTNGAKLEAKAEYLKKAGLDSVLVSLDSTNAIKHDMFRGYKGLFKKAIAGIKAVKKTGMTVGISTVTTKEQFKNGELEKMIEFGKKIGVNEIVVFDAIPSGRYSAREDLLDDDNWIEDMTKFVEKYNTDSSYPGIFIYGYTVGHKSVGCSSGTNYCYVSPYGDMMPCDFNHAKFGNVIKEPFYKVWEKMTNNVEFKCSSWDGCRMKKSTFRKKAISCSKNC